MLNIDKIATEISNRFVEELRRQYPDSSNVVVHEWHYAPDEVKVEIMCLLHGIVQEVLLDNKP